MDDWIEQYSDDPEVVIGWIKAVYLMSDGDWCDCVRRVAAARDKEITRLRAELARMTDHRRAYIKRAERWEASCARAVAELAECRAKHMDDLLVLGETAKAERELRAELARYRRDASRYRWLRHYGPLFGSARIARSPATLDRMIDHALAAEGEK